MKEERTPVNGKIDLCVNRWETQYCQPLSSFPNDLFRHNFRQNPTKFSDG